MQQMQAGESGSQRKESLVEGSIAFVADQQSAVAVQPGEGPLGDPAVAIQALAGVDQTAGTARDDVPPSEQVPVLAGVVALVGVQLGGATAWPTGAALGLAQRRDGVHQALQQGALVDVGGGREDHQRRPAALDYEMVLAARLAPIGRVRPDLSAPLIAVPW